MRRLWFGCAVVVGAGYERRRVAVGRSDGAASMACGAEGAWEGGTTVCGAAPGRGGYPVP
jgi:hypothetical protein